MKIFYRYFLIDVFKSFIIITIIDDRKRHFKFKFDINSYKWTTSSTAPNANKRILNQIHQKNLLDALILYV